MISDIVKHAGIKGMRWGVRKNREESQDYLKAKFIKKKKIYELSNAELQAYITRMNLEGQYKNLNPSKLSIVQHRVSKTLGGIGDKVIKPLGKEILKQQLSATMRPGTPQNEMLKRALAEMMARR